MEIKELKEFKRYLIGKYKKTQDHDLIVLKRCLDRIIERKLKNEDRRENSC